MRLIDLGSDSPSPTLRRTRLSRGAVADAVRRFPLGNWVTESMLRARDAPGSPQPEPGAMFRREPQRANDIKPRRQFTPPRIYA